MSDSSIELHAHISADNIEDESFHDGDRGLLESNIHNVTEQTLGELFGVSDPGVQVTVDPPGQSTESSVHVGLIHHDHGTNVYVGDSEDAVLEQFNEYVQEHWDRSFDPDEQPDDPDEAREEYFERMNWMIDGDHFDLIGKMAVQSRTTPESEQQRVVRKTIELIEDNPRLNDHVSVDDLTDQGGEYEYTLVSKTPHSDGMKTERITGNRIPKEKIRSVQENNPEYFDDEPDSALLVESGSNESSESSSMGT